MFVLGFRKAWASYADAAAAIAAVAKLTGLFGAWVAARAVTGGPQKCFPPTPSDASAVTAKSAGDKASHRTCSGLAPSSRSLALSWVSSAAGEGREALGGCAGAGTVLSVRVRRIGGAQSGKRVGFLFIGIGQPWDRSHETQL